MTTMFFRTSASVIALFACTSLAAAADLEGPSYGGSLKDGFAAPAVYNWTGLYLGAHAGFGWADIDTLTIARENEHGTVVIHPTLGVPIVASNSFDSDGWIGGLQLGYNIHAGRWVIGLEGDYSWSDISGSFNYDPNTGPQKTAGGDMEWLATIRARVGHAFDRVLVYGTAGVAFAEFDGFLNNFEDDNAKDDRGKGSSKETGWTVGGGVEVALAENITVKGEYLYMRFNDVSGTMKSPHYEGYTVHVENDVDIHTFRVGVNYKFGN